jgi:hypothetical protein
MHNPPDISRAASELILDHAEAVTGVILLRAERAIDAKLGALYARKNPLLLQAFARILYDEYTFARVNDCTTRKLERTP